MQYSTVSVQNVKRTLAVLAIFALIFGPFAKLTVAHAEEEVNQDTQEQTQNTERRHDDHHDAIQGCMDETSPNYNATATVSDNSCTCPEGYTGEYPTCVAPVLTCQDDSATNFGQPGDCVHATTTEPVIPDPVLGCMDDTATNYNPAATQDNESCRYAETTNSCKVTVVSDTTNTVTEKDGANAVAAWVKPTWLQTITGSVAQWIWGSTNVENPTTDETETFVKKFTWNGPVTTAVLKLAADNSYVVKINGTEIGSDLNGANYSATDNFNVQSNIVSGENTIEVTVYNNGFEGATSETNPAGTLYSLTVTGSDSNCAGTPTDGGGSKNPYELFGFVWNDTNKDDVVDSSEENLSGWIVHATNASDSAEVYTASSDAAGRYSLHVPAGKWIISEVTPAGWVLHSAADGDGTYTVTVPVAAPVEVTFANWFIATAEAASLETTSFGPYNFGNNVVPNRGHHHRTVTTDDNNDSTPSGQVLGDSTTKPAPVGEVLGAATTTMPVGAPNTGAGGTSATPTSASSFSVILATRTTGRKTK